MVDMGEAARAFGDRPAVCGNFDPVAVMLQGAPDQVQQAVWRCMELGGARSISAAGCEIPDGTPPANLQAQAQALQSHNQGKKSLHSKV
jgi:uroporphyrinogen-III decarboxylase